MLPQIICTIGPSSINFLTLKKMKENGMNIARINTKYGNPKQWEKMIQNLRKLNIEILIDIKSLKYLDWVKKIKPNYIAVSFAETVSQIKQVNLENVKIIAKIESIKGVKNSLNLINSSHGVMVARGDLSKAVSLEKVPAIQKEILLRCNKKNKFGIIATEMLLSMVKNKQPTNAEVSDVFIAILSGAKAVMLSEETAIGKNPSLSVLWMNKIIKEAKKTKI